MKAYNNYCSIVFTFSTAITFFFWLDKAIEIYEKNKDFFASPAPTSDDPED